MGRRLHQIALSFVYGSRSSGVKSAGCTETIKFARSDAGRTVRYASAGMEYISQVVRKIDYLLSNKDDCVTPMKESDDLVSDNSARKPESNLEKQVILDLVNKFKKEHRGRMNWKVRNTPATNDQGSCSLHQPG
ncbi:hypothetical protein BJV82DRAFT_665176 [Fennellomyces sp. T-0311]|nr:hypothetical protein BJV82DRAFT_665176 [Fennellomyces sp. T-0311]